MKIVRLILFLFGRQNYVNAARLILFHLIDNKNIVNIAVFTLVDILVIELQVFQVK